MSTQQTLRVCLTLLVLTAVSQDTNAQREKGTGTIRGSVQAAGSQQGLEFVNITLEGTTWGTSSLAGGTYLLKDVPQGVYSVVATLIGYEGRRHDSVAVIPGGEVVLHFQLHETAIQIGEVQVTASRAKEPGEAKPSVLAVAPARARTLPGVGEDVLRTLQTLPGVLAPNDFSSQLVIRGSGPDENLIIMDDIEVLNPYRLYGLVSMFNPETISDITLSTGGFGAQYGDRLSSVLDVTNREGDKRSGLNGSINASVTNANIVLHGASPFGISGSYVVAARRTYYDLILGPIAKDAKLVSGDVAFPNFYDIQLKVTLEPDPDNKIILNGILSKDAVQVVSGPDREAPDSVSVTDDTHNNLVGLSWHSVVSDHLFSKLGVSWYRNDGQTEFGGEFLDPILNRELYQNGDTLDVRTFKLSFDSRYEFEKLAIKEYLTLVLPRHTVTIGAGVDVLSNTLFWDFRPDETFQSILAARNVAYLTHFEQASEYARAHLYAQDIIPLSSSTSVQVGGRVDYYGIIGALYVSPRISVSHAVDPLSTVKGAVGLYFQSPGYEKLIDQNGFLDLSNADDTGLRAERAIHYVVGIDRWLDERWKVSVESYYKDFADVIVQDIRQGTVYVTSPVPGNDLHTPSGWTTPQATVGDSLTNLAVNEATGSAYGIEVMLQKRNAQATDLLSGWISYAFARADRSRRSWMTPFRFDQRHTLNVVLDFRPADWWEIGMRLKYGSGYPYSEPVGIEPRLEQQSDGSYAVAVDSRGEVILDIDRGAEKDRYNKRLPAYHRLDVRLSAFADYWGLDWTFYLDVINVYNRTNVIGYQFYLNEDLTIGRNATGMFPILPTLGFSVRF